MENEEIRSAAEGSCIPIIENTISIIGGKWSFLVLTQLWVHKKRRFSELQRSLPNVSSKALTDTLRSLEHNGMLTREVFATVPVTVEYSLSEKGADFQKVLHAMQVWGKKWADETM
ncbi:winged helix-turn-helix transcriptional regulator [Peribacillus frigoritolerans]|uniref:winged helix-turn-helix transcriptional regulator n=1 Tax=Peribacillus frigoritolerans TaxID=450367 RepID=UPI0010599D28|nr:helix-turn-helix domain-containing protein [Peribacillus frigoritolerans]TDL80545.1 transcriptional regulator [Peribacillus frigoritolerans]